MTPWAGRRSLSSQLGANRTRLGCVHSDKSWAGIGLLLSQAEEEKLHPFLPLERKRRMSSVLCPWYRSAPQFSGRGEGQQQLQGQEDIDANIVPTTAISTLSPHPHTSPSLQGNPATAPRTQHRGANTQCWGHPPPCSNPEGDLGDAREEGGRGRAYLHRLPHGQLRSAPGRAVCRLPLPASPNLF